ncbi:acyltransferase-like protein [Leucobacter luti]|uniref:acyltransferase family protein n=1 Tax=Leucobacter luti TaxID=340320 RepID=UPI0010430CDB|nr:acyltransferase [Leucobacter luti]MCW2288986.1 peptidoglycan/LPS O-acetylase OafA/YrhL [Leucobacter luti]TCK44864.1 acyltransferase-like protein [Leucobacter luti]
MTLVAPSSAVSAAAHPTSPTAPATRDRATRDRAVDLVRAACLIAVVTVHALMVGASVSGDDVVLENALEGWDLFTPFSWFAQMMPLFFILGGFASATHFRRMRQRGIGAADYVALRLRRLLPVPLAAALAVATVLSAMTLTGLSPELVATAGWRISQPLWFLGVYVLCSACVPLALRAHERAPRCALAVLGGAVLLVDGVRFATGIDALGFANLLFVWLFVQQLGFWLADGRAPKLRLAGWAVAGIVALMLIGASPVNLFEALNPPTAPLALLGVVQFAVFARLRPRLAQWAELPRVRTASDVINGTAMTIYSWHMPVVVLLAGVLLGVEPLLAEGTGTLLPVPLSAEWWASRPLWLVAAGLAVAGVVALVARLERRPGTVAAGSASGSGAGTGSRADSATIAGPGTRDFAALSTGRATLAVLSGAGGVLVILAATGALWAWLVGVLMLWIAIQMTRPEPAARSLPVRQNANPIPSSTP